MKRLVKALRNKINIASQVMGEELRDGFNNFK